MNIQLRSLHHGLFGGSNDTCPLPKNEADLLLKGEPIAGSLTFQHLLFIISIVSCGISAVISLFLIIKHLHRYSVPREQRQIIRMIFTPVVFSFFSAMGILDYQASIYLTPIADLYEAFGLCALFLLFVEYVAPDPVNRESYFANLENRKPLKSFPKASKEYSVIPGGCLRWFKVKWVIVFAYVFAMIVMTIVREASQGAGTYCATSFKPRFAHFWVVVIENVALVMAALQIFHYYNRMKHVPEFAKHKPGLKFLSFKAIVWVNFIQNIVFEVLTGTRAIHGSTKVTGYDITYGLPNMLVAVESIIFTVFFHYSFRSREYHESMNLKMHGARMGTFRAAAHAFNPWDLFKGIFTAVRMVLGGVLRGDNSESWSEQQMQPQWQVRNGQKDQATRLEPYSGRHSPSEFANNGDPRYSTEYNNTYGNHHEQQPMYPPPPGPASYQPPPRYYGAEDETTSLNPGYVRAHSRDPSMDREATSMKRVV